MSKPRAVKELQALASDYVGAGSAKLNLFFVTDQGTTVTVTREGKLAYRHWLALSQRVPRVECALEDNSGVICSVEPHEEEARLIVWNDAPKELMQ